MLKVKHLQLINLLIKDLRCFFVIVDVEEERKHIYTEPNV